MQLKDLCGVVLMVTLAATCIQAQSKMKIKEERLPGKLVNRRIATLVVDDSSSVNRIFQQPKVIYRKIAKKSYTPAPTYVPRRTKYGPPRSLKKPVKKHRSKNGSKPHFPYPYKKRTPNPRYGPPKKATMKPVYGPPKKNNRIYSSIGFGEPPADHNTLVKRHRPPKPSERTRTQKPYLTHEISSKPHNVDFSSPSTFGDNYSNGPHIDDLWNHQEFESASSHLGHGEPPVDSYGAPIKANLRDLTFSTAQSALEPTSHLDEDRNFGPESRPWNNFQHDPDNNFAHSKKQPILSTAEEGENIFVTPVPEKQEHNQELHLNSYSDIYNYRQEEKAKQEKKKKRFYQKNVKMINRPWVGAKMKEDPKEEIIVGGQYAEPPARHVAKYESSALLFGDDSNYAAFIPVDDHSDMSVPISSYVNYKNSNMAFSPQNLNDVFSIVDK